MASSISAIEPPRLGEPYLLTPGPLTTSWTVKQAMLRDWGSWDDEFRAVTREMRTRLLAMLGDGADGFDCVPMQGSGSFSVEAMLGLVSSRATARRWFLANGAYGQRSVANPELSSGANTCRIWTKAIICRPVGTRLHSHFE